VPEMTSDTNPVELATELTVAWLANPNTRVSADDVPAFLNSMHQALGNLSVPQSDEQAPAEDAVAPAVTARKSLASKDHILSMIDGKPYKTLRRHLARHGLTPEQYRERFGLKRDYPMVSEAYSEVRRAMAKRIGLGRKPRDTGAGEDAAKAVGETTPVEQPKPKRAGGRKKALAAAE
jgi:predicted transcriptional regulator